MTRRLAPLLLGAALCLAATMPARAQELSDCGDFRTDARNIPEPWEASTRTFANGEVRLVLLDTIEPAAAPYHLMILSPPYDEVGGRQCKVLSRDGRSGWAGVQFDLLEAGYDPATGLTLTLPAMIWLPEKNFVNSTLLTITLNQSTGEIGVTQQLGNE
ncbi:hypothetical protein [Oceanicola sp. 502str15]|uniref:hypothetical protein n=1 Tax=Oceanicola sp. 502str15 TaxID=2696061 RepID=UPI0020953662|nr:hypothetical protein [Oceanicola sp. 502str15]MCO6384978.1 hypothetical protein [Oceanicola sp. 502str15]